MSSFISLNSNSIDLSDTALAKFIVKNIDLSPENVDDQVFMEAVHSLTTSPLDYLHMLPCRLRSAQKKLKREIEKLAATHYSVFLDKADASHVAFDNFQSILSENQQLLSGIGNFIQHANSTLPQLHDVISCSRKNAKTLEKQTQLLELLELPQLCETCIRGGYYDDAISILTHTKRLSDKHSADLPVIRLIGRQVHQTGLQLVHQLCNQLRSPITLSSCIKTLVLLRRTEAFTEEELRLKFLQARGTCLRQSVEAGVNAHSLDPDSLLSEEGGFVLSDSKRYSEIYLLASRRIEATRTQLFDIITQYRVIFADEGRYSEGSFRDFNSQTGVSPATAKPLLLPETFRSGSTGLSGRAETTFCHSWLVHQLNCFLQAFTADFELMLQLSNPNSKSALQKQHSGGYDLSDLFGHLNSLVAQAMHFARSFSRLGCDFSPQLAGICINALKCYLQDYMLNSVAEFSNCLRMMPWRLSKPAPPDNSKHAEKTTELDPPAMLTCYPPLVVLCNRFLNLFNGLKLFCPTNLRHQLIVAVTRNLHAAAVNIVSVYRCRQEQELVNWRSMATSLAEAFSVCLTPYLLACVATVSFAMVPSEVKVTTQNIPSHPLVQRLTRLVCAPVHAAWPQLPQHTIEASHSKANKVGDICPPTKVETIESDELPPAVSSQDG